MRLLYYLNFSENKHEDAVRKWKHALRKISRQSDRCTTTGYLTKAYLDWGKYREAISWADQQLQLANQSENSPGRASAYISLARAHQKLGDYRLSVSYCRHALYNVGGGSDETRFSSLGAVYVTLGHDYTNLSEFSKAVEFLETGLKVARESGDSTVQLECFMALGQLFTTLKDFDKGLKFHLKAFHACKSFVVCDLTSRYHRQVLVYLANTLRKVNRLCEAVQHCEVSSPNSLLVLINEPYRLVT